MPYQQGIGYGCSVHISSKPITPVSQDDDKNNIKLDTTKPCVYFMDMTQNTIKICFERLFADKPVSIQFK